MTKKKEKKVTFYGNHQSLAEEIANSLTHGLGLLLSIFGSIFLVYFAATGGTGWHLAASIVFSISLILVYLVSTFYHAIQCQKLKPIFQRLDHICIYLLIAGSYSLVILILFRDPLGWTIFGLQWGLALAGTIYKAIWGPRFPFLETMIYLIMGWMALFMIDRLFFELPTGALVLALFGGLSYTVGVIFYATDNKYPFFHAIWHLFVLAGSICHYFMGFYYLLPSA